jgi:hypothetical protein
MRMLIEVMGLLLLRFVSLKVDELDRIVIGNVEDVVYVIDENYVRGVWWRCLHRCFNSVLWWLFERGCFGED